MIYTSRELSRVEETQLKERVRAIILKDARSPTRLLEETSLFLHSVERRLPARKRADPAAGRDGELAGKTVLVIDDDVRNIFALTTMLEERGLKVLFAENGRDGLRRLAEERPDLILSDLMMPEMDGFAFLEAARANTLWASIPFVMLSARGDKDAEQQALALGARRYLTKPVDVEALLAIVAHALADGSTSRA